MEAPHPHDPAFNVFSFFQGTMTLEKRCGQGRRANANLQLQFASPANHGI